MRRSISRVALLATLLVAVLASPLPAAAVADCSGTSTGLVPLTDLGTGEYEGAQGGLYPGGSNEIPADHLALGMSRAEQVVPRGPDGTPSPDGKIVFISIGVSNTLAQFNGLSEVVAAEGGMNPNVLIANTAQTGRALGNWALQSSDQTWNRAIRNIEELGGTAEQVQVAWMMLPPRTRGPRTLEIAESDLAQTIQVVQTAKERFPNLQLMYVSSRMYGGYVPDADSEPNAYLHGFSVKWLIEDQIEGLAALNADPAAGQVVAPWLAWGPYLWADGLNPRSDGLIWECSDFAPSDGTHPFPETGAIKVGQLLYDHLIADPTATWFEAGEASDIPPPTEVAPTTITEDSVAEAPATTTRQRASDDSNRRAATASTDRVRQNDRAEAAPETTSTEGWPATTLIGVGLAGVVLGAIAGSAGTRLWADRKESA